MQRIPLFGSDRQLARIAQGAVIDGLTLPSGLKIEHASGNYHWTFRGHYAVLEHGVVDMESTPKNGTSDGLLRVRETRRTDRREESGAQGAEGTTKAFLDQIEDMILTDNLQSYKFGPNEFTIQGKEKAVVEQESVHGGCRQRYARR